MNDPLSEPQTSSNLRRDSQRKCVFKTTHRRRLTIDRAASAAAAGSEANGSFTHCTVKIALQPALDEIHSRLIILENHGRSQHYHVVLITQCETAIMLSGLCKDVARRFSYDREIPRGNSSPGGYYKLFT
jgi:hypothetical protein